MVCEEDFESLHSLELSEVEPEQTMWSQADVKYCTDVQKVMEGYNCLLSEQDRPHLQKFLRHSRTDCNTQMSSN